jgi:Raf kinase inhibitor-like YbhB/YbcL family protein
MRIPPIVYLLIGTALLLGACGGNGDPEEPFDPESSLIATIDISSAAFENGADIPVAHTCDGDNISPPLRWSDVPQGTRSIAIIVDDPDAPGRIFRHWSVFNIPSGTRSLEAGRPATPELTNTTRQAKNDFGGTGYGGPCPPQGQEHEYVFFIYALSEPLELDGNVSPAEVSAAIRGKVVGTGSFSGMYARR